MDAAPVFKLEALYTHITIRKEQPTSMQLTPHLLRQLIKEQLDKEKLSTLSPNDKLKVYHGTSIDRVSSLINGFDATKIVSRHYGGPRHAGIFVTPNFRTALRFAHGRPVILEIMIRAKNLHGTDYSGVTGREDAAREKVWKEFYPGSFRPYLSQSLLQETEPQALLKGLVSPENITKIWYAAKHPGEAKAYHDDNNMPAAPGGNWYTREDFMELNLKDQKGNPIQDYGVDVSYPNYSREQAINAIAKMVNVSEKQVQAALERYIDGSDKDGLIKLLRSSGFEPKAANAYANKFLDL